MWSRSRSTPHFLCTPHSLIQPVLFDLHLLGHPDCYGDWTAAQACQYIAEGPSVLYPQVSTQEIVMVALKESGKLFLRPTLMGKSQKHCPNALSPFLLQRVGAHGERSMVQRGTGFAQLCPLCPLLLWVKSNVPLCGKVEGQLGLSVRCMTPSPVRPWACTGR